MVASNHIVEKIEFKLRTQAMLNFAPMIFTFKQPRRRDLQVEAQPFWGEEAHSLLGPNFKTMVDQDGLLRSIRIEQFLKEYRRIQSAFEKDPHLINDTFNVLQEGLMRVSFNQIMQMAYNKYAMQAKMRSRSSL